jgi:hypothetical protein
MRWEAVQKESLTVAVCNALQATQVSERNLYDVHLTYALRNVLRWARFTSPDVYFKLRGFSLPANVMGRNCQVLRLLHSQMLSGRHGDLSRAKIEPKFVNIC